MKNQMQIQEVKQEKVQRKDIAKIAIVILWIAIVANGVINRNLVFSEIQVICGAVSTWLIVRFLK